jgi:hypothetical protein
MLAPLEAMQSPKISRRMQRTVQDLPLMALACADVAVGGQCRTEPRRPDTQG